MRVEPVNHAHKILTNPCAHMWKMEETRENDNSCITIVGLQVTFKFFLIKRKK